VKETCTYSPCPIYPHCRRCRRCRVCKVGGVGGFGEGSRAGLKACEERAAPDWLGTSTAASRPPANERRAEVDYAPTSLQAGFISLPHSYCTALPFWTCERVTFDLPPPPFARLRALSTCYIAVAAPLAHSRLQNSGRHLRFFQHRFTTDA
jgi:hypothetical protein